MKKKLPAFLFYPSDYLGKKVLRMSDASQGIYWRLICYMWNDSDNQCSIEKNCKIIEKILGISKYKWNKAREEIQWKGDPILLEEGEYYVSKRLRKEKEKQTVKSLKASQSAKHRWDANAMRGECERNANAMRTQCYSFTVTNKKKKEIKKKEKIPPFSDEILQRTFTKNSSSHMSFSEETKVAKIVVEEYKKITGRKTGNVFGIIIDRLHDGFTGADLIHTIKVFKSQKYFIDNPDNFTLEILFRDTRNINTAINVPENHFKNNGKPKNKTILYTLPDGTEGTIEEYNRQLSKHKVGEK